MHKFRELKTERILKTIGNPTFTLGNGFKPLSCGGDNEKLKFT